MENEVWGLIRDIISWKELYGDIFCIKISGKQYIFRSLNKAEHTLLLSIGDNLGVDTSDMIVELCLLHPRITIDEFSQMLAGSSETLLKSILDSSGFSGTESIEKDINAARDSMNTLENQIVSIVCKAFPGLKPDAIDKMNYSTLIKYLAMAESMLDIKLELKKNTQKNQGAIDFDKENEVFGKTGRFKAPHNRPSGESMPK